tara:strand:- start:184 stop:495 length:312 start_codon:yes stop_codon:yes gene_type:complete
MIIKLYIIIFFLTSHHLIPPDYSPVEETIIKGSEKWCRLKCNEYKEKYNNNDFDFEKNKYLYTEHHLLDILNLTWNRSEHMWCICVSECMGLENNYCSDGYKN